MTFEPAAHFPGAPVLVGPVPFGGGSPLALIAGPCVIESRDHCLRMADAVAAAARAAGVAAVFKASYDKANRTSGASYRGPGEQEGLAILAAARDATGLPILTDVHSAEQCAAAAEVVDVLQIPAFLCRQTDLLLAAGRTGKPVNVKKGQFAAPWDMKNVVEKVASTGNAAVMLTERGATFGYNNLVSDMRSLVVMRAFAPVIFDATHSVQLPGGQGGTSGGQREFVEPLARAAAAVGIDGLFVEVHDDPDRALSDGPNALPLDRLGPLLETVKRIAALSRAS